MYSSGQAISLKLALADPPYARYTCPDACIVSTSVDMLKSVRYAGFPCFALNVDCAQPLRAPMIIDVWGPRRMSAAMSTTYDTDMLEPLAIGNWTLKAEVSDERRTRKSR